MAARHGRNGTSVLNGPAQQRLGPQWQWSYSRGHTALWPSAVTAAAAAAALDGAERILGSNGYGSNRLRRRRTAPRLGYLDCCNGSRLQYSMTVAHYHLLLQRHTSLWLSGTGNPNTRRWRRHHFATFHTGRKSIRSIIHFLARI